MMARAGIRRISNVSKWCKLSSPGPMIPTAHPGANEMWTRLRCMNFSKMRVENTSVGGAGLSRWMWRFTRCVGDSAENMEDGILENAVTMDLRLCNCVSHEISWNAGYRAVRSKVTLPAFDGF